MRIRDTSKWGIGKLYPDLDRFLGAPVYDGLHTIQFENTLVDFGTFNRHSPVTVVTFQPKVNDKTTVPAAVGVGFTKKIGANLVALADPGIDTGTNVDIGWYYGSKKLGDLLAIYGPVIEHCLDAFGSQRTILWGSSAGGYGALRFGTRFPGSLIFTINPVVSLTPYWKSFVDNYITTAQEADDDEKFAVARNSMVTDIADLYPSGLTSYLAMYQNTGDHKFLPEQHGPFIERFKNDPKLFERRQYDGEWHLPIPPATHFPILEQFMNMDVDIPTAIQNAGFYSPNTAHPVA